MSYTLLIVESPAKCKKIESYLGTGYKCIASYGHIQELPGIKNIDIQDNFKPSFQPMESKSQQISKMRIMIKNAKEVLLASDDDREGEAIGWHICQVFNLPLTTKRIVFHEITKCYYSSCSKSNTPQYEYYLCSTS
jgi:DNA topoisomerase-1